MEIRSLNHRWPGQAKGCPCHGFTRQMLCQKNSSEQVYEEAWLFGTNEAKPDGSSCPLLGSLCSPVNNYAHQSLCQKLVENAIHVNSWNIWPQRHGDTERASVSLCLCGNPVRSV